MIWLAWKGKFNLLTITLFITIASFALNISFVNTYPVSTFYWPAGRSWELLSGSILAWLKLYKQESLSATRRIADSWLIKIIYSDKREYSRITTVNIMSSLGCIILAYGVIHIDKEFSFPGT
jgi:peptidoglycan/LPS O-acetylase OafA/YrhL